MARVPATELSLEYLRKQGMRAEVVERMIFSKPFPKKRDLFNIFDIIAIGKWDRTIYFVQTTSASNRAARRTKMEQNDDALFDVVHARGVPLLHSWKKRGVSYEVVVESVFAIENGKIELHTCESAPTMKSVRERWRKLNPAQDEGERESKPGQGLRLSVRSLP